MGGNVAQSSLAGVLGCLPVGSQNRTQGGDLACGSIAGQGRPWCCHSCRQWWWGAVRCLADELQVRQAAGIAGRRGKRRGIGACRGVAWSYFEAGCVDSHPESHPSRHLVRRSQIGILANSSAGAGFLQIGTDLEISSASSALRATLETKIADPVSAIRSAILPAIHSLRSTRYWIPRKCRQARIL